MKTTGRYRNLALLLVGAFVLSVASGCATYKNKAPYGAYWLAGGGASSSSLDKPSSFSGSVDTSDAGWMTAAGITFARYGAFEAAYVDLGEVTYDGQYSSTPSSGSIGSEGWKASLFGNLPLGKRVRLQGEAGWFWWSSSEREIFDGQLERTGTSGSDLMYGAGFEFDASKRVAFRLLYEQFRNIGEGDGTSGDYVDLATLSVVVKFGVKNKK